ncbi:MAG: S-methyl-5'-thioadenosine phosphorylase [Veillonellaceae bacterium]|nr:S-methyl-5'-thioadenosine phosphorylase [Veillonellaceae bacterium]
MARLAIIGGTGVYDPSLLTETETLTVATPYGEMTCILGKYGAKEVVFMTRHGADHSIPPHRINYRANIYGLKKLGVGAVIATTAVGSLRREYRPGELVITDQLLDFTKTRAHTFFDGAPLPVAHVDMTEPYCPVLRELLLQAARKLGLPFQERGTYVCTEGPRFETGGEVAMYARLGGDIVGMTNAPECPLAREAEMAYATVSLVTNYGAGISPQPLTHAEVVEAMNENTKNLQRLLQEVLTAYDPAMESPAHHALREYGGFEVVK